MNSTAVVCSAKWIEKYQKSSLGRQNICLPGTAFNLISMLIAKLWQAILCMCVLRFRITFFSAGKVSCSHLLPGN